MTKHEEIRLSDREMAILKAYADERGLSIDDAASELEHEAIAKRFRQNLNRGPARVYPIGKKKS